MNMMKNHYEILGVLSDASKFEIKASFRRLAKTTHPDSNTRNNNLAASFTEIVKAYAMLSDPKRKEQFDKISIRDILSEEISNMEDIEVTAKEIEYSLHLIYKQVNPYKEKAVRAIIIGVVWLIGGMAVSLSTYLLAAEKGEIFYFIFLFILLLAMAQGIRNIYKYCKLNNTLTKAEGDMWKNLDINF